MNSQYEIPAGRPIRLTPTPPGLWQIINGGIIASLAPLFGFLIGSMIGDERIMDMPAIFLFLFVGIIIGGLGIAMALLGGLRLYRHMSANKID